MDDDIYSRLRRRDHNERPTASRPVSPPPRRQTPQPRPPVQPAPAQDGWSPEAYPEKPKSRPHKGKKRLVITLLVLLLLGGGGAGAFWYLRLRQPSANKVAAPPAPAAPLPQPVASGPVRLVATGDMMAHDSINQNAKKPDGTYDYSVMMEKMKPFFEKADIKVCNQATPSGGDQFGISGHPVFNAPVDFARGIEAVGCNVISLASDHMSDKGQPAIDATVAAWDNRQDILVAGANRSMEEQAKPRMFEAKGMRFAYLAYSVSSLKPPPTPHGVNIYNEQTAKTEVAEARKNADFVIVSMNWGTDLSADINPQQDQIAQVLADAGASLVLGHGSHKLQPVKQLKTADNREVPVWFSLGNFLHSQLDIETLTGGLAVIDIDSAAKKITAMRFMPTYQHYEWTAQQASRGNAADLAARNNFQVVPLDLAGDLLPKAQHKTTVPAQTDRIKQLLNKFTPITIITSTEF